MARRRRVELGAIASLDEEIARVRDKWEDQVQRAYERLRKAESENATYHDRYLDSLRPAYEAAAKENVYGPTIWPAVKLQALLGEFSDAYKEIDAFERVWKAIEGVRQELRDDRVVINVPSFDVLKAVLRADVATRMLEHDAFAIEQPVRVSLSSGDWRTSRDEVKIRPVVALRKRRRGSGSRGSGSQRADGSYSHRVSDELFAEGEDEYTIPINSVIVPLEYTTEVLKKSQNWLGRWRTRHLTLRWNELEMNTKSAASQRSGAVKSFPSQPAMLAAASHGNAGVTSPSTSANSKRYALHNLLSVQFIQLNESEPSRKLAVDLHFKQTAASGHGHTTKSLILGSDKGSDMLKKIVSYIATMALFRGIAAAERPGDLQKFVQVGANVNAFCKIPSFKFPAELTPLQLALLKSLQNADTEFANVKMLISNRADQRCLLHWHFARRVMFSNEFGAANRTQSTCLFFHPSKDGFALSPSIFGSDEYGWTLAMYLALIGDVERVNALLDRVLHECRERQQFFRYLEHVNGAGETALHVAIKSSVSSNNERRASAEDVALAIVTRYVEAHPAAKVLFFTSDGDGETVLHLALKAKMWRLVNRLLQENALDLAARDEFGNNVLHVTVKVGAPQSVVFALANKYARKRINGSSQEIEEGINARNRTENATPLALAIQGHHEDLVLALLEAGAATEFTSVSGKTALRLSIQAGLPRAAQSLWRQQDRAEGYMRFDETIGALSCAIRHGMYSLAHDICADLRQNEYNRSAALWRDRETGYPTHQLAVMAGQLELVAILLDCEGPGAESLQYTDTQESVLHALLHHEIQVLREKRARSHSNNHLGARRKSKSVGYLSDSSAPMIENESPSRSYLVRESAVEAVICEVLRRTTTVEPLVAFVFPPPMHNSRSGGELTNASMATGVKSTVLHTLPREADETVRKLLILIIGFIRLKKVNPSSALTRRIGPNDETPLHLAIRMANPDIALLLLHELLSESDADVQPSVDTEPAWISGGGTTLLHLACQNPNQVSSLIIADLLLQKGCYSGAWDMSGLCPLHVAVQHQCDCRMIQLFKKHDQDLNVWTEGCSTTASLDQLASLGPVVPIMLAILHGNVSAFRELIRCGADVRIKSPHSRMGLLQFAAHQETLAPSIIREVVELATQIANNQPDAEGMTPVEAVDLLRGRLEKNNTHPLQRDAPSATREKTSSTNEVVRITLLGPPTVTLPSMTDTRGTFSLPVTHIQPSSPRTPPRSPSNRAFVESQVVRSPETKSRDATIDRQYLSKPPSLDDSVLAFLKEEEKATLTLVAHEARNEAQDWLKKRSGQRKLLSEARAQLQATHNHRRTGSGTVVFDGDSSTVTPVTDHQLLETYMALAAKHFVDKHVADAVNEARLMIEREKRTIFHDTGIFPGELPQNYKTTGNSAGSSISSSRIAVSRTPSMNGSMLTSVRSNEPSEPGNETMGVRRGWWGDHGSSSSFSDEDNRTWLSTSSRGGTFLSDSGTLHNGTWLSNTSARGRNETQLSTLDDAFDILNEMDERRDTDEQPVQNPLERESFVHIIAERKTMT